MGDGKGGKVDRRREHEEPFGFDGRSLEEQLASLDAVNGESPGQQQSTPDQRDEQPQAGPGREIADSGEAPGTFQGPAAAADPRQPAWPDGHPDPPSADPAPSGAEWDADGAPPQQGHRFDPGAQPPGGDPSGTEILGSWPYEGRSWQEGPPGPWSPEAPAPPGGAWPSYDNQGGWGGPPLDFQQQSGQPGRPPFDHPPERDPGEAPSPGPPGAQGPPQRWPEDSAWGGGNFDGRFDQPAWQDRRAEFPPPGYYSPEQPPGPQARQPGAAPPQPGAPQHPVQPSPEAGQRPAPDTRQSSDSLSPETLLRGRRRAPAGGWRRAVYRVSGGTIHPGESPAELRRRHLVARARTVVSGGHHRVAVLSLKGGVGKTTTTIGLGSTLAALRGDRVVAIDANPDRGTLSDKLHLETAATVRDLLNERENIRRYADVRAFTSQAPSRLEVLASDRDPAVSEAFSDEDYRAVARVLEHFYSICITDCGTGLLHSAMSAVLRLANQVVLVSSPSVDGARSASATLDWLEAHDFGDLVRSATVVLSGVRDRSKSSVDLGRLEQHFASRCNAVVRIPYDPHLEEGAEVELDRLRPASRDAYHVLAATVGDGFGQRRGVPVMPPPGDGFGA